MVLRSGWFLVALFLLSYGISSFQLWARAAKPSVPHSSPNHDVFPYALLKWRAQTYHQITTPVATPAPLYWSDAKPGAAPIQANLEETGPAPTPSADSLYVFMSLQR
jgi:hypothetical protein